MAESVLRFKVETLDANAKIAHLTKKVQGLEVAVKNAGGTTRAAGTGFKAFGSGAQAAAVGARGLGAALSTALAPLVAVGAAAASLGQVFGVLRQQDFAEAKVRSLGVNSEELTGRLKDVSRELSGQASVVDLTSAAYDVASAGFTKAADAAKILKAASQGATGGFSDINTVGDATTSVLNAYGLEADKAAKLVDGFIQTQNDGKIVIGEYAANIAKVAPVAAALGVPLEEVNAAVAQITAGGQGAEVTFTALKTAFAQVAAGKVGKEFAALGVEINASTLKTDGLAGTLEKIKKSGADAGTVIKAFGTEAGPSILALLNNTEKYNKLLENQKNAQGAAAKAAFEASDTIDGQLKRLTTAFQNLFSDQSELGVIIKETFKVAAVTVEVLTVAINNAVSPVRALFAFVNEVGSAIATALGLDGVNAAFKLEKGFQAVLGTVAKLGTFIIGLGKRIGQFVGGVITNVVKAGQEAATRLAEIFGGVFGKIRKFLADAYTNLPPPLKALIEGTVNAVSGGAAKIAEAAGGFVSETINVGAGFAPGAGLTQDSPANNIVKTSGLMPGGGQSSDKEAENAKKIAEASAARVQSMQDQTLLASALTAEERKQFERQIQIRELEERRGELTDDQLKKEMEALLNLFDQQDATQALIDKNKKLADDKKKAQDAEKKRAEELKNVYQGIGDTIADGVVDALKGAVTGTQSLAQAATNLLNDLANQMLQLARNMLFFGNIAGTPTKGSGLLGSLFGGFMADGGTVQGGKSYVVGEKGPELFTPGRTGSIAPNEALGANSNFKIPTFDLDLTDAFNLKLPTFEPRLAETIDLNAPTFAVDAAKSINLATPAVNLNPLKDIQLAAPTVNFDPLKDIQLTAPTFEFDSVASKPSKAVAPSNPMGEANIVVNVDASGSSVEGDAQQSKALGQALGAAVKAELIKQKMPGGLLA